MRVKLVRKFANILNDVDLTDVRVGDVLDLKPHQAAMLIVEGWAEQATSSSPPAVRRESSAAPESTR